MSTLENFPLNLQIPSLFTLFLENSPFIPHLATFDVLSILRDKVIIPYAYEISFPPGALPQLAIRHTEWHQHIICCRWCDWPTFQNSSEHSLLEAMGCMPVAKAHSTSVCVMIQRITFCTSRGMWLYTPWTHCGWLVCMWGRTSPNKHGGGTESLKLEINSIVNLGRNKTKIENNIWEDRMFREKQNLSLISPGDKIMTLQTMIFSVIPSSAHYQKVHIHFIHISTF